MTRTEKACGSYRRDDSGMTLVELMVAFLLLSILCMTVMSASSHLVGDTVNADTRTKMNANAQLVMDTITRQLTAATAAGSPSQVVTYATPDEVTFYSSLSPNDSDVGPDKFDISLSGANLTETTWTAVDSGGGVWTFPGSGTTETLSSNVDSSQGPLFSYYTSQQNAVTESATSVPANPTVNSSDIGMIEAVRVDLWVGPSGSANNAVVEETTVVHLINVDCDSGSPCS